MYRLCWMRHLISGCLAVVLLSASPITKAADFSEAFKAFVLGSEARAATVSAAQLPPASGAEACMQCHDGSSANRVHLKPAGTPVQYRGGLTVGHPVGMDYDRYAIKNPGTYTRPAALDKRVVLEDGAVTCLSCHRAKSRKPAVQSSIDNLAQSTKNSCNVAGGYTTGPTQTGLCMACHTL